MIRDSRSILSSLYRCGAKVWVERGLLRIRAPKGAISAEDLAAMESLREEIIRALMNVQCAERTPIGRRTPDHPVPLTALQSRFLAYCGMVRKRTFGGIKTVTRVRGPMRINALRSSLDAVQNRHESLRTRVVEVDGTCFQDVDEMGSCEIDILDLSRSSAMRDTECEVSRLVHDFLETEADIRVGPLFAGRLIKLSDQDHVLVLAIHHFVSDAVSVDILHREMWALYKQELCRSAFSLPELPIQFPDYAEWQAKTYNAWLIRHASYWLDRLSGARATEIPVCDGLIQVNDPVCGSQSIEFGALLSGELRNLAQREQTLLALVVLTLFVVVMARWCDKNDLLLLFQSNGRFCPELENMIGFVTTLHWLRVEVNWTDTFEDILKRVTGEFYSAYDHFDFDRVPDIVPQLNTEVGLCWAPTRGERLMNGVWMAGSPDQLAIETAPVLTPESAKFAVYAFDGVSGIYFLVRYRADIFLRSTIERFGTQMLHAAKHLVLDPSVRLCEITSW